MPPQVSLLTWLPLSQTTVKLILCHQPVRKDRWYVFKCMDVLLFSPMMMMVLVPFPLVSLLLSSQKRVNCEELHNHPFLLFSLLPFEEGKKHHSSWKCVHSSRQMKGKRGDTTCEKRRWLSVWDRGMKRTHKYTNYKWREPMAKRLQETRKRRANVYGSIHICVTN